MAIGFFDVRVGIKDNGERVSAIAHSDYVMGKGKYANKQDEIIHTDCFMPEWAINEKGEKDPNLFWSIAEKSERKNANVYREHVIALPRELDKKKNIEFIESWINQELKGKHYYNYAIHNAVAKDGKPQPHLHLMFSERIIDEHERTAEQFFKRYNAKNPEKGGAKKANTGLKQSEMKQQLKDQRKRFGELLESHLKMNGHDIKIDMRNWRERGLDEPPPNLSFAEMKMVERLETRADKLKDNNPSWQALMNEQQAYQAKQQAEQAEIAQSEQAQVQAEPQAEPKPRPKPKPRPQERPQAPSKPQDDLDHHTPPKTPQNATQSDLEHDDDIEPSYAPPRPKM